MCAAPASADIKLSKTQLSKKVQSSGFLGRLLGPLLKTDLPLKKSVLQPLDRTKRWISWYIVGILSVNSLGNMLVGKGVTTTSRGGLVVI